MRLFRTLFIAVVVCAAAGVQPAAAQDPADATTKKKPVEITVYPILIVAPIFGASVDLPSLPSRPPGDTSGESGDQAGDTDVALQAAYMAGITVRGDRWMGEMRGQWASLSASRQTPRLALDTEAYFFFGKGGVRLIDGFWVTAGFRRMTLAVDASLTLPTVNKSISGSTRNSFWDPLIGVAWRHKMGSLTLDGSFDGGGFGVGLDSDIDAEARVDWRFAKHAELRAGYSFFYYKFTVADVSIGQYSRTLVSSQKMHGPIVGIGIPF